MRRTSPERQVDIVGDAAQQPRGIGHPVPPGAGDIGRAAEIGHGVSQPIRPRLRGGSPHRVPRAGDVVVPGCMKSSRCPQLMAVEADGTLAVHPRREPQGPSPTGGVGKRPRVAEIAVVAAVPCGGVVAEIAHAGRNVYDAKTQPGTMAGTAGRRLPTAVPPNGYVRCGCRAGWPCALSRRRKAAKGRVRCTRFIMACVFRRGALAPAGNGVRDRYSPFPCRNRRPSRKRVPQLAYAEEVVGRNRRCRRG